MKAIDSSLFHRVVPPLEESSGPHPVLILLHGRGADEEDLLGLAPALDPHLLLLSVRAPFPFMVSGGYTWYDIQQVGTPHPKMFAESYERLSRFLDDALQAYPIDPARVFLFGFSMGAVMSCALGLTRPALIRGVVAHSGYVPEETSLHFRWNELASTAFFIAHGTEDPVISVEYAHRARTLFESSTAPAVLREYSIGHTISEASLADAVHWMQPLLIPPASRRPG
jgi:phospholipase/carboxylesterase